MVSAEFSPRADGRKRAGTAWAAAKPVAPMVSEDEEICFDARRHGVVLARPLAQAALMAAAGAVLLAQPWPLAVPGAALVVLAAAVLLRAVWRWERTRLVVTTDKVCVLDGTLRRRSSAVRLRAVENLELEQSVAGRLLGYGTLVAGPLEIDHVPEPRSVYRLVERLAG
jgi:uncharacterized membrane protein YdbT with pleckstrin-like domain